MAYCPARGSTEHSVFCRLHWASDCLSLGSFPRVFWIKRPMCSRRAPYEYLNVIYAGLSHLFLAFGDLMIVFSTLLWVGSLQLYCRCLGKSIMPPRTLTMNIFFWSK